MRMNKYLASTLLTGLLVTAAIISPAQGQEQSLQPQGAWALTKVDRSAQGGNSYCTLSRKYDQDIVLSLGRNQTEEYSLAIDFQKQTFEKDKSLKINLQPGPGQIRAYDMMPTSDKALVIRLGWDEGFFDTLNKSQQMKVKIADKSYAFAMPEIAKGQGELRDCMEGLKAAAKGGAPAEQTKDVLAAEAGGSRDFDAGKADEKIAVAAAEKSVLQNFADSIKAQEPSVNDEGDVQRKNFGAKKDDKPAAKKAAAEEPVKTAKAEKTEAPRPPVDDTPAPELIKRPAHKPAKKADAKIAAAPVVPAPDLPRLAPAASDGSNKEELASLQKRLDQLVSENAALKQKAAASAAPSAETQKELAALETEKKALEDRVKALEAKIAQSAKPEDVAKAQARAQELEIKNAQLEESLRSAQVRIGETAVNTEAKALRKIADLEVKLTAAKNDNANLAKQLESMRLQSEDGRLGSVAGDWDLEQATKRYNEAEREVQRLSKQLEQERMSCNREKAEIEQMLFDPAVTDKKQIEKLTQLQKELDDAHALIKDNQKQIQAAVDQQMAAKTQEMAAKIQTAEKEKAAMAQQVAALQKSVAGKDAAAKAENDGLKAQMAALQAVPKENAAATAKKIQDEVAKARAALDTEISTLKKGMAAKDQQIAALKAQPKADPQQVASLQQALAAKDQELAALKAVPKADPNATAQQIAAEVAKARAPLDAEIAKLKQGVSAKDQQIAAIQATPRTDPAILKQVADMQTSMAALRQENETLRQQVTDAAVNGGARADQVASLQLQVNELKDQISRKDTQNLTYQNQIAALQQAARQAPAADDSVQVAELTRQIYGLQKEIADMRRERSASAAQYAGVQPAAGAAIAAAYRPAATASAAASKTGYDAGSIKSLLQKAGLSVGGVSKTSGMPGAENFGWTDGGNVKGTASVKMSSGGFDNQVSQYIAQQKSQCGGGDFASMPSPTNSGGVKRTALYETACVNGGSSVSSSILFFEDQGRFIAISNQIDAADMDVAMDSRDKIASFVRGL
jgi:chromosome segregation ATPase